MAETNIAYATDSSVFTALEALVLHNLPDFGPMGDGILNNNFLLAFLKQKNKLVITEGGLEAWHGLLNAEQSNFKWQAHTAQMTANLQDPADRLRFPWKTFTGSIVINKLHEAMNKGKAAVIDWSKTLTQQAESQIKNDFNSAFWSTSPGANEPESIPSLVSATPTVGTVGGLTRSTHSALQNGAYPTAVGAIGAQAGLTAIFQQVRRYAVGSSGKDAVDLVMMSNTRYGSIEGYLGTLQRYRPDDKMASLGFDTIKYGRVTFGYENTNVSGSQNTISANYIYGLNSEHLFFKVLRDGNFMWNPKGFERVGQSLNRALYYWVFCNLTTNLPKAHFVMTNVTG